jgi:hypothetical protein
MRRTGTAAEVARAVLWLCSAQSSFITGIVLPIDGGQSAGNKPPQMYRPGQPMTRPSADPIEEDEPIEGDRPIDGDRPIEGDVPR